MQEDEEIRVFRKGRLGRIHLNRPKALNSLTLNMVRVFAKALQEFADDSRIGAVLLSGEGERGLCAGGDIRTLYELQNARDKSHYRTFWREEYQLNARIANYPKPYIALMDGLVMGGGVGISAHGGFRVITERTRLAMPETAIGFIPDVGGTWLLARSGGIGSCLALTGRAATGADILSAQLADWAVDSGRLVELVDHLETAETAQEINTLIADMSLRLDPGPLMSHRSMLDWVMNHGELEVILDHLSKSSSPFMQAIGLEISKNSPTSLKVTLALLRRAARSVRLEECLIYEFRAACRLLESHDLYEGIRAAVIDKDKSPKWRPGELAEVSNAAVADILCGDGTSEPVF